MGQTIGWNRWQINCRHISMKIVMLFFILAPGCTGPSSKDPQSVSTVDSNVVSIGDTTAAILHIDTIAGSDTAFYVAMDSAGATLTAKDTIR